MPSFSAATPSPTVVASCLIPPPPSCTSMIRNGSSPCPLSRTANQHSSPKDQGTSQRHLRCSRHDRRLHVSMSNPGDDSEFNENDEKSYSHCRMESRDQERQGMADPTESCYGTGDQPPGPQATTLCHATTARHRRRRTHTKPCTKPCVHTCTIRVPRK